MATIVSGFISDVNSRKYINTDTYYELGKIFLKSTTPKIIFVDEKMFNKIEPTDYDSNNTIIIKQDKKDMYLYDYIDTLTDFYLSTTSPEKDTIEYMFTNCYKTEWIKKAIEMDAFGTDNYIWIDFGIRKNFNCNDDEFIERLNKLHYKKYDDIRIASIWNLEWKVLENLLAQICWFFAGGVFGGNKTPLLKFADLMKEKCIEIMTTHKTIMWEVNVWYIIYLEHSYLFNPYYSDHSHSIIDNY